MTHMMFFGYGFCAAALTPILQADGWRLSATTRDVQKAAELEARGITPLLWPADGVPFAALNGVTHALISAPPQEHGDPVLAQASAALAAQASHLAWVGYLSTTGVYGDHGGAWIDEESPLGGSANAAKRGWRRRPNGAILLPSMECRSCISGWPVFMARGAIS